MYFGHGGQLSISAHILQKGNLTIGMPKNKTDKNKKMTARAIFAAVGFKNPNRFIFSLNPYRLNFGLLRGACSHIRIWIIILLFIGQLNLLDFLINIVYVICLNLHS